MNKPQVICRALAALLTLSLPGTVLAQRFVVQDGTVLDTTSGLMWAAKDNAADIGWAGAGKYSGEYRGGGHADWRMPTQDELAELYRQGTRGPGGTPGLAPIVLTGCCPWAAETKGADAAKFDFNYGNRDWGHPNADIDCRVLPVRKAK